MLERAPAPVYQRSTGRLDLVSGGEGPHGRIKRALQEGSAKVRFPRRVDGRLEAMVLNTAGGLAGGDRFHLSAHVRRHTLITSTQASERVYRAEGGPADVRQAFAVDAGARLLHWPQPTLLYDRSALRRHSTVSLSGDAALTFCEGVVLGRLAMGERVEEIMLRDRLDIYVDGALVLADATRLDTEMLTRTKGSALLAGNAAFGLVVHRDGDGEGAVARAREALGALGDASFVNGLVVARLIAQKHGILQDALARLLGALTGVPLPRAWQI